MTSTTPNGEKLTDGASLISPNKDEVQFNGTSIDVGFTSTFYIPTHDIDVKTPDSIRHGLHIAYAYKKGLKEKGAPRSTLKRELGRLDAYETGQSSIFKYSTRNK